MHSFSQLLVYSVLGGNSALFVITSSGGLRLSEGKQIKIKRAIAAYSRVVRYLHVSTLCEKRWSKRSDFGNT